MYGGELIDVLPMRPGTTNGMLQQLPSSDDLRAICQNHPRVAAGYEVLLANFLHVVRLVNKFDVVTCDVANHVGTGEPHFIFSVPCADCAELSAALEQVKQFVPG
jgi:hypothetical protein